MAIHMMVMVLFLATTIKVIDFIHISRSNHPTVCNVWTKLYRTKPFLENNIISYHSVDSCPIPTSWSRTETDKKQQVSQCYISIQRDH